MIPVMTLEMRREQRAQRIAAEKAAKQQQQPVEPPPLKYGVKKYVPHAANRPFPIAWNHRDESIIVNKVEWEGTQCVEIAWDTPYNILHDLLKHTGGYVAQRATLRTNLTVPGDFLLSNEMQLPGIQESQLTRLGKQQPPPRLPRPAQAPITFIIGSWEGKLELPEEARPAGIPVETEEIHREIRAEMQQGVRDAKASQIKRELKLRAAAEKRAKEKQIQCKKEKVHTPRASTSGSSSGRETSQDRRNREHLENLHRRKTRPTRISDSPEDRSRSASSQRSKSPKKVTRDRNNNNAITTEVNRYVLTADIEEYDAIAQSEDTQPMEVDLNNNNESADVVQETVEASILPLPRLDTADVLTLATPAEDTTDSRGKPDGNSLPSSVLDMTCNEIASVKLSEKSASSPRQRIVPPPLSLPTANESSISPSSISPNENSPFKVKLNLSEESKQKLAHIFAFPPQTPRVLLNANQLPPTLPKVHTVISTVNSPQQEEHSLNEEDSTLLKLKASVERNRQFQRSLMSGTDAAPSPQSTTAPANNDNDQDTTHLEHAKRSTLLNAKISNESAVVGQAGCSLDASILQLEMSSSRYELFDTPEFPSPQPSQPQSPTKQDEKSLAENADTVEDDQDY